MQFWIYPNSLKHVGWGFPYRLTSKDTEVLSQVCAIAIFVTWTASDQFPLCLFLQAETHWVSPGSSEEDFPWQTRYVAAIQSEFPSLASPRAEPWWVSCPACLLQPLITRNPQRKRYPDMRGSHSKGKETLFLSQYKLKFLLYFLPHTAQAKISMNYNMNFYCIK